MHQTTDDIQKSITAWGEYQSKLWGNLLGVGEQSAATPTERAYGPLLGVYEESMMRFLQAQLDWVDRWKAGLASGGNESARTAQWAEPIASLAENSINLQRQFWTAWFKRAREMDPFRWSFGWPGYAGGYAQSMPVLAAWQKMTECMFQAQNAWLSAMTALSDERPAAGQAEVRPTDLRKAPPRTNEAA